MEVKKPEVKKAKGEKEKLKKLSMSHVLTVLDKNAAKFKNRTTAQTDRTSRT